MDVNISVIIINYNKEIYLQKCINSVLMSSVLPNEIIIVDDHSTDNSLQIVNRYVNDYGIIKVLPNVENIGASASRDKGIKAATSEYIMTLDSDDWYEPTFIEKAKIAFKKDSKSVLCPNFNIINEKEEIEYTIDTKTFSKKSSYEQLFQLAARKKGIPGNQLSISKNEYLNLGGLDPSLRLYEDWDLQLRITDANLNWKYVEGVCYNYRKSGDGLSASSLGKHMKYKFLVYTKRINKTNKKLIYLKGILSLLTVKGSKFILGRFNKYGYN